MDCDESKKDSQAGEHESKWKLTLENIKTQTAGLHRMMNDKTKAETVPKYYRDHVIPPLLTLRLHNRNEKKELNQKSKKVKELYKELMSLEESCANLEFEVSCLQTEVKVNYDKTKDPTKPKIESLTNGVSHLTNGFTLNVIKNDPDVKPIVKLENSDNHFNLTRVASRDHPTRMQLLEEEKNSRVQLQQQLAQRHDDITTLEKTATTQQSQIDKYKPCIKQLLDVHRQMDP